MLQFSTIESGTLEVLNKLMAIPELNDFYLVGGTCLALKYGHRVSVDLDLFSVSNFKNDDVIDVVEKKFEIFTYSDTNNIVGVFGFIGNIKVDFINYHQYIQIDKPDTINGIRMFSDHDIIAMKISAILKRAQKKDFWDIAELLHHYSVSDSINYYNQKYPNQQLLISIPRALTYFVDAEESEDPISLKGQTWETVKSFIQQKVNDYLK